MSSIRIRRAISIQGDKGNKVMQGPFISVIVPVYKVESYLPQCVESLLGQIYPHFELLLIDDGSPDRSGGICDEYAEKDSRIRVFHKVNGGVSSARNLGLDKALGEWVVFVDSDDYVDPDYLGDFIEVSSNVDLVIQGIRYRKKKGNILESTFDDVVIDKEVSSQDAIRKNKLFHCGYPVCKLFKMEIIRTYALHFDEQLHLHEDHLFVFDYLIRCQAIRLLSVAHYYYCLREDGMSLSQQLISYQELLHTSDSFLKRYDVLVPMYHLDANESYVVSLKHSFGISQRIRALYSFYLSNQLNRQDSIAFLKKEFVDNKALYMNYYKPRLLLGKFLKIILLTIPAWLLDRLLKTGVYFFCNKNMVRK